MAAEIVVPIDAAHFGLKAELAGTDVQRRTPNA
jgi:hypothetical protein